MHIRTRIVAFRTWNDSCVLACHRWAIWSIVAKTKREQNAEKCCAWRERNRVNDPLVIEPSRMTFSIVNTHGDIVRVAICGRLDGTMIGVFRRELTNLLRIHPACVDIDMSRLRFVDDAGVQLLLSFFENLTRQGGRIVVHGLRTQPPDSLKVIMLLAVQATSGPVN